MRKRDRLEVIFDILCIIREHHNSIRPTPLLRASNLSTSGFAEYYEELVSKGFIKEVVDTEGIKYSTLCDKGFHFIERYDLIRKFIDDFEL